MLKDPTTGVLSFQNCQISQIVQVNIYFNGRDGLLLMPNICFHDAQFSWKNIFFVSSQEISLNILITMKKDAALKITYDCGFTYIKLEAAVLSFPSYSCSEHFWKFNRKMIMGESFFQ